MIFFARLFSGIALIFWPLGAIGNLLGDTPISLILIAFAIPITYLSWLTWRSLGKNSYGDAKFYIAHLSPGVLIAYGLIPLGAPNKISTFIIAGLSLIFAGLLIIFAMHKQRKIAQINRIKKENDEH